MTLTRTYASRTRGASSEQLAYGFRLWLRGSNCAAACDPGEPSGQGITNEEALSGRDRGPCVGSNHAGAIRRACSRAYRTGRTGCVVGSYRPGPGWSRSWGRGRLHGRTSHCEFVGAEAIREEISEAILKHPQRAATGALKRWLQAPPALGVHANPVAGNAPGCRIFEPDEFE